MQAFRLPLASGWGALVSLVMFWALWSMINAPIDVGQRIAATAVEFTPKIVDSKPEPKPTQQKPVLDIPEAPPRPHVVGVPNENPRPVRTIHERPTIVTRGTGIKITAAPGGTDRDVQPVVRIEPDYPPPAERRGIEGWVKVQFSITSTGRVTDVMVVDATPRGVFEDASIEAVRRWLYNPKIEDGIAVERVGLQTVLRFKMPE